MLNRRRLEHELAEEMEIHREMMPADRRAHFGNIVRLRDESREAWPCIWYSRAGKSRREYKQIRFPDHTRYTQLA
jgi:hypothetical protein